RSKEDKEAEHDRGGFADDRSGKEEHQKGDDADSYGGHNSAHNGNPLIHGKADAQTGGGDFSVALHQHGGLVIILVIKIVEDFGNLPLLDNFLRSHNGSGGKVQGAGE